MEREKASTAVEIIVINLFLGRTFEMSDFLDSR
jgi:hypothetical protein